MDYNILIADFAGKNRICMTDTLYQYDYGQKLKIESIPALPQTFEAHFSNVQHGGVSITVTGMDGIVDIPNSLLMTGKRIYCWIYVTEPGSGETEYQVLIPVQARPMPEYYDVTDVGVFDSVVQQVGDYAATATAGATNATASATAAAASASEAAASALAAETAKNAAETAQGNAEDAQAAAETAAQTATEKAQQTAQDAAQAAQSKADAESAAGRAEAAQTGAESAKADAETAAQGAAASASAASASATSAGRAASAAAQSATAAAQSAASIEGDVQIASQKAAEAQTAAGQAVTAKDAAQTAQQGAETAATNAGQSASTATAKAAEAAQSASNAAGSKTAAEAAAIRAETAAASLTVDSALSETSENPVQNKVVTESVTQLKSAIDALKIVDTASGAIASFPDGAAMPVESLTVELEPIQNLNGQDAPYPAGGGNNKLPITLTSGTYYGLTVTVDDKDGIKLTGTTDSTGLLILYSGDLPSVITPGESYIFSWESAVSTMRLFAYNASSVRTVLANSGSATSVNVTIPSDAVRLSADINVSVSGTTYNVTVKPMIRLASVSDATYAPYSNICPITGRDSVTVWREASYDPSADPALTVQLGQTVYGGTVDVTTGVLTVDRAIKTFDGTESGIAYAPTSQGVKRYTIQIDTMKSGVRQPGYCNLFPVLTTSPSSGTYLNLGQGNAYAYILDYDDVIGATSTDEFKAWLAENPIQIVYPLATPLEITLDPTTLSTLKGDNTVWSDGDSVTVEYVADPKLYIDKKITAAVAALA